MARKKITDENEVIEENAVIEENETADVVNNTEVSAESEEKDSFTNSEIEVDDYNSEISVKTEEVTKDKTKKARKSLAESFNTFQNSIPVIIITFVVSLVIMGLACIGVFFANVKGEEQVLVPNVVGKKWDEALLEMQTKELYPRITL